MPQEHRLGAQANFHFRVAEVLMMLMLPLLAVALAVPPKRSSSALGIFIGIVIVVAYHKVNQYAEQAASQGRMEPILALWVPLIALAALIFWMYHVLAHRPGGQPIGAIEWAFAARRAVRPQAPAEGANGMINLQFFPSRRLALYTVKLFVTRSLAVLVALILVLMTLDLLGESGKILAVPGNGEAQLWQYVSLRLPLLISRFLPFAVLLGTLIAFTALNQHSEVVAMKAAGISAHQMLAPLIVASLVIAGLLFAFNERVVVNANRQVTAWSDNDYRPVPPESGILSNVWLLHGDDLIQAGHAGGHGQSFHVERLRIYDREGGNSEPRHPGRPRRSAEWRMEADQRADLRFIDERGPPRCRK